MKKNVYLAIMSVLFISCDNGDAPTETINLAPTIPTLALPINNKLCINNAVSFEWNAAADANNDAVVYQIQIAKDKNFVNIIMSGGSSATYQNFTLEKGTAYYWRVKAIDSKGLSSSFSSIFSLYTSGVGVVNYLPFLPDLVAPELNALVNPNAVQLKWTALDVDVKDKLVYDVYFGTTNPPVEKISDDLTASALDVVTKGSKEYFWKVVVKDGNGGNTVGPVWRFRTN